MKNISWIEFVNYITACFVQFLGVACDMCLDCEKEGSYVLQPGKWSHNDNGWWSRRYLTSATCECARWSICVGLYQEEHQLTWSVCSLLVHLAPTHLLALSLGNDFHLFRMVDGWFLCL